MHHHILMPLLVTAILLNVVQVVAAHDECVFHLSCADHKPLQDAATNAHIPGKWAFLVHVSPSDCVLWGLEAQSYVLVVAVALIIEGGRTVAHVRDKRGRPAPGGHALRRVSSDSQGFIFKPACTGIRNSSPFSIIIAQHQAWLLTCLLRLGLQHPLRGDEYAILLLVRLLCLLCFLKSSHRWSDGAVLAPAESGLDVMDDRLPVLHPAVRWWVVGPLLPTTQNNPIERENSAGKERRNPSTDTSPQKYKHDPPLFRAGSKNQEQRERMRSISRSRQNTSKYEGRDGGEP
jgi:hypothetical protein